MSRAPSIELVGQELHLSFQYDAACVAAIKELANAKWLGDAKLWVLPYSEVALEGIKRIFPALQIGPALKEKAGSSALSLLEAAEQKFRPELKAVSYEPGIFRTTPYPHQVVSFNFAQRLDASALFLEQGLGKAKIALDLAAWRYRQHQIQRALIVCPASVLGQWLEEITKHGHSDFSSVVLLAGSSTVRRRALEALPVDFAGLLLINYEGLLPLYDYLVARQKKQGGLFQMMILDESSKIKHASSQRSKVCWRLGRTVRYRNILSGTPITQSAEDVFSQYRFLNQEVFGPFATAFRAQYLLMGGFEHRQVIGYRNIDSFLSKVYSHAIRFTKDRCLDLPPKVYTKRTATLDADASEKYTTLEKECVAEFGGSSIVAPLVMTKLMKLSQITGGFIYEQGEDGKRVATHRLVKNPKLAVLMEVLDETLPKKAIVWCRFTEEIRQIREALGKAKIDHVWISGEVPIHERQAAVAAFQRDPAVAVFLGQVATAGLGITLTAAEAAIYYSNSYSLEERLQSEDRCHRIGQAKSVLYVDIVAELSNGRRTIDADILEVLRGKAAFANTVSLALMQKMVHRQSEDPTSPKAELPAVEQAAEIMESEVEF